MKFTVFPLIVLFSLVGCASGSNPSHPVANSGAVSIHGRLHTEGNKIVGSDGQPVSLAGVSFGWSQWEARPYYNADVVHWLKTDWNATVVRAALGIKPDGYLGHPEANKKSICAVVDAAIAENIYVLIDWHDHNANKHTDLAVAFFQEMAREYGTHPNVMYEIFNEPITGLTWARDVKPYAEKVIAAIRAIDPDNLIIVGTPKWSQDVDIAAKDPIKANNIAYSLHFYAGTHKQSLRDKAVKAMNLGLPIFVTEWGTCDASGDGKVDAASTAEWMAFMRQWGLSHCNWDVCTKRETASIILPSASIHGDWKNSDLTESGRLARKWIRDWSMNPPTPSAANASH